MPDSTTRIVVSAFKGVEGKRLLEYLEDTYQKRKLFNDSATKMAYNCGQADLVEDLKHILENAKHE